MGCICSKEVHEPKETLDEIYKHARTGDIFLFSGQGSIFSCLIRCNSLSKHWSHVGIVLEIVNQNGVREVLIIDSSITSNNNGVQAIDLRDKLKNYGGSLICYKQLNIELQPSTKWDQEEEQRIRNNLTESLLAYYTRYNPKSYEIDPIQLVGSTFRTNVGNDRAFFCTEFAAGALMQMGVIPYREHPDNYTLFDFTDLGQLNLNSPFYFSDQIYYANDKKNN